MHCTTAEQVVAKVCGTKARHHGPASAQAHARNLECSGQLPQGTYAHYRCPFAEDGHWHVGHVPSMDTVAQIARVIRGLDPNPPQPKEHAR